MFERINNGINNVIYKTLGLSGPIAVAWIVSNRSGSHVLERYISKAWISYETLMSNYLYSE
jgi:hypothetical protein